MIIEYTGMVAKCKDCAHLRRTYKGRRVVHKCARLGADQLREDNPRGWSVTLQRKACEEFKLFGS